MHMLYAREDEDTGAEVCGETADSEIKGVAADGLGIAKAVVNSKVMLLENTKAGKEDVGEYPAYGSELGMLTM